MRKQFSVEDPKVKSEASLTTDPDQFLKKDVKIAYAVVDAAAVNVRQQPSTESQSIDILKKGEKVQLGPKEGEFTFIFYGFDYHKAGYMMSKYLKVVE